MGEAITLDHSTWEVVRVLREYSTDLFWEALEIAKQKYVEEFFNKVEDDENDD